MKMQSTFQSAKKQNMYSAGVVATPRILWS